MPVSLSTIRQRIANKMVTLSGFTAARNPFNQFNRNPDTVANKRFSIGIPRSIALEGQRQNPPDGILMETTVLIKWPFRIRPKDQVTDYDRSMDVAQDVITAIIPRAAPLHEDLQITMENFSQALTPSGEFLITILEISVIHSISLS